MPALFEAGFPEDAVWLIILRHTDFSQLERLAEALGEMTGRKVGVGKEPVALHGGDIWVLPNETDFTVSGNHLQPIKAKGGLHLDRFFLNLCDAKLSMACLLLTGPTLEGQGGTGLKALYRSGALLYAIEGVSGPAGQALDLARKEEWLTKSLPARGALARVQFGRTLPEPLAQK
jgi:CheB methylesterase